MLETNFAKDRQEDFNTRLLTLWLVFFSNVPYFLEGKGKGLGKEVRTRELEFCQVSGEVSHI